MFKLGQCTLHLHNINELLVLLDFDSDSFWLCSLLFAFTTAIIIHVPVLHILFILAILNYKPMNAMEHVH